MALRRCCSARSCLPRWSYRRARLCCASALSGRKDTAPLKQRSASSCRPRREKASPLSMARWNDRACISTTERTPEGMAKPNASSRTSWDRARARALSYVTASGHLLRPPLLACILVPGGPGYRPAEASVASVGPVRDSPWVALPPAAAPSASNERGVTPESVDVASSRNGTPNARRNRLTLSHAMATSSCSPLTSDPRQAPLFGSALWLSRAGLRAAPPATGAFDLPRTIPVPRMDRRKSDAQRFSWPTEGLQNSLQGEPSNLEAEAEFKGESDRPHAVLQATPDPA